MSKHYSIHFNGKSEVAFSSDQRFTVIGFEWDKTTRVRETNLHETFNSPLYAWDAVRDLIEEGASVWDGKSAYFTELLRVQSDVLFGLLWLFNMALFNYETVVDTYESERWSHLADQVRDMLMQVFSYSPEALDEYENMMLLVPRKG